MGKTKAEREAILEEAKRLLLQNGYDPAIEFDNPPEGYTSGHSNAIMDHVMANHQLNKERARSITAKALRQLRYRVINARKGSKNE